MVGLVTEGCEVHCAAFFVVFVDVENEGFVPFVQLFFFDGRRLLLLAWDIECNIRVCLSTLQPGVHVLQVLSKYKNNRSVVDESPKSTCLTGILAAAVTVEVLTIRAHNFAVVIVDDEVGLSVQPPPVGTSKHIHRRYF